MRKVLTILFSLCLPILVIAQNESVGINTTNPANSAILDVVSNNRGVLIPRMTSTQRTSIASPVSGLLVYDNTTNTFWYYESVWIEIASSSSSSQIADSDDDTKIQTEESTDEDIIRFDLGGTEKFIMTGTRLEPVNSGNSIFYGVSAGLNDDLTDNRNVFIGTSAGQFNVGGTSNIGIGYRAFRNNTSGNNNIALGEDASFSNTTGSENVAIGSNALFSNQTSNENLAIGFNTMQDLTTGSGNIAVGNQSLQNSISGNNNVSLGALALQNNINGSSNVAIGREAGQNATGSGNVFIGFRAGENEIGDNKLYIDNNNTTTPLIWGDFGLDSITVNGNLRVSNNITYIGTITDVSDKRLKKDITILNQVLPKVLELKGYSYYMKGDHSKKREYGLMAQDVEKHFPFAVSTINEQKGYLGVSYLQLVPVLLQAINEQQEIINRQKAQLEEAELRLVKIGQRIEALKFSESEK